MERMTLRMLRQTVWLLGYDWSDEELERLLPVVMKNLELIDRLGSLPLRETEPAVQYRLG